MNFEQPKKNAESADRNIGDLESKLAILETSLANVETLMSSDMENNPTIAQYADDQLEARENLLRAIQGVKEAMVQERRRNFRVVE